MHVVQINRNLPYLNFASGYYMVSGGFGSPLLFPKFFLFSIKYQVIRI